MHTLIDTLIHTGQLSKEGYLQLLTHHQDEALQTYLTAHAQKITRQNFGYGIYTRGLIEFTNYCKQDCYYCGIRKSNLEASRYRLNLDDLHRCATTGYGLGFRTFVLQGGEDPYFTDDKMVTLIRSLKKTYPDCAITLSIGEKSTASYLRFFEAGADRYLLRHETATPEHYQKLHPDSQSLAHRQACLRALQSIGYQVGTGFMVGSPYQTLEMICEDLLFIQNFKPHMIGIGPFLPHNCTPFKSYAPGPLSLTLFLISLLRLMHPHALIPATTALGTLHPTGREQGILAGANVVMPNLSPCEVRLKYSLYNNKICTGEEAAECWENLDAKLQKIGYHLTVGRGDFSCL